MALYNLSNATSPDQIMIDTAASVPALPVMLLVFAWCFVFIGGSQRQSAKYGYADIPQWGVLASMATLLLALIMTTTIGLLPAAYLYVVVGLNILTGVWFFMSRGRFD